MILIPINSSVSIPNSKPPSPNRNKVAEERTALEAQIAAQDRAGKLIIETEGIDIYPVDRNTKEARLKLRSYLAQRIERIDITFGARIVTAGPVKDNPIKGLEAGEGKLLPD